MKYIKKLYGGLNLTWPAVIIAAAVIGVAVGGIMLIPVNDQCSIKDIGVDFTWWIFFGEIIVLNSKSPVDAAAKAFVFFLISQPLIYLVQVPFVSLGWDLMGYYRNWILWTFATIPMGAVGYFIKRGDIIAALILTGGSGFLAFHLVGYITSIIKDPPYHAVTAVFCAVFIVLPIIAVLKDKPAKLTAAVLAAAAIAVLSFIAIKNGGSTKLYSPTLNCKENGLDINADTVVMMTVNIQDKRIYEVDGEYMLYMEIVGTEAMMTVDNGGTEKTYTFSFNEDKQIFEVTEDK
ncbi:MAG: hypothetical protein IKP95_01835 [Ruminococcus sp.]|nr:hypothetical protein [Ruminococcus sp.]